jgi:hypothetical protein
MIKLHIHPRVVMEILGHSQISTTMNTYGHVLPEVQREAVTVLDTLFSEASAEAVITAPHPTTLSTPLPLDDLVGQAAADLLSDLAHDAEELGHRIS